MFWGYSSCFLPSSITLYEWVLVYLYAPLFTEYRFSLSFFSVYIELLWCPVQPYTYCFSDTSLVVALLFILLTMPVVLLITLLSLSAEPRVGKPWAERREGDLRSIGTAGAFVPPPGAAAVAATATEPQRGGDGATAEPHGTQPCCCSSVAPTRQRPGLPWWSSDRRTARQPWPSTCLMTCMCRAVSGLSCYIIIIYKTRGRNERPWGKRVWPRHLG